VLSGSDKSALEGISFKISRSTYEVIAGYTVEDHTLEIQIKYPSNHPLRMIEVSTPSSSSIATIVTQSRLKGWILSITSVMVLQNGSLLDALSLFKNNLSLHFDGVEDCAICYSVIGMDRSLPKKECKTCKHLFHASCLYKVFLLC
jgi:hypothetical protein